MTYCGKYILDENGDQKSFFPQEVCKKTLLLNSVAQILRVHLRSPPASPKACNFFRITR